MIRQEVDLKCFTDEEAEYLLGNSLGRIATVSNDLEPHVVPIAYEFDGTYIYFSGYNLRRSLKFRQLAMNNKVAFIVDDVAPTRRQHRGIEIRGTAQPMEEDLNLYVRITPYHTASWGL